MHVWLDLISRELLFLALSALLGLAPAAWLLPDRFDGISRLALAPVLGICVGVCLTTTTLYAFPAGQTGWLVVVVAAASAAIGLVKRRGRWAIPSKAGLAQIGVVIVVLLVSFDYPLAALDSVGPIGGYRIADASGYVSEIASAQKYSIHQIDRIHSYVPDLATHAYALYVQDTQQLDVAPLEANVNSLIGLGPSDTQTAFLIAIILTGALGAFGTVRAVIRHPAWPAVLAGCLFAGPLFVELLMDGSEAALAGAALLAPIAAVGWEALRERRWPVLVLFALMVAGLQSVYPLFLPAVVLGVAAIIVARIGLQLRAGRPSWPSVRFAATQLAGVVILSAALTPVAFVRNLTYVAQLQNGTIGLSGLPVYALPLSVLPGWLLQTREFYGLVQASRASASQLLTVLGVPILLLAVIVIAARRHRAAAMMVAFAVGAMLLAAFTWLGESCSYCVQRNLLPTAGLAPAAIGIGLAALASWRRPPAAVAAAAIGALALVFIGHQGLIERQRLQGGAYVLSSQERHAAARIPPRSGFVELEGFGESGLQGAMELVQVYDLLERSTGDKVSLPTISNDNNSLSYFDGPEPFGPSFVSNYQYVLTRLGGVSSGRRTVARFGPIVLQRRAVPLDVSVLGGVAVADAAADPRGEAWVDGALALLVSGGQGRRPAWVSLTFRTTVPARPLRGRSVVSSRRSGRQLRVCLRATGVAPVRSAGVQLAFSPVPPPAPSGYGPPLPARGVRLTSMRVSLSSCQHHP
jgi:hypothetical protein